MSIKHQSRASELLLELSEYVYPGSAIGNYATHFDEIAALADKWEQHGAAFEALRLTFTSWLITVKELSEDDACQAHKREDYGMLLNEFHSWVTSQL